MKTKKASHPKTRKPKRPSDSLSVYRDNCIGSLDRAIVKAEAIKKLIEAIRLITLPPAR